MSASTGPSIYLRSKRINCSVSQNILEMTWHIVRESDVIKVIVLQATNGQIHTFREKKENLQANEATDRTLIFVCSLAATAHYPISIWWLLSSKYSFHVQQVFRDKWFASNSDNVRGSNAVYECTYILNDWVKLIQNIRCIVSNWYPWFHTSPFPCVPLKFFLRLNRLATLH